METLLYQRFMIDALEEDDDVQNVYSNASDE